jgi:hypothetical protein
MAWLARFLPTSLLVLVLVLVLRADAGEAQHPYPRPDEQFVDQATETATDAGLKPYAEHLAGAGRTQRAPGTRRRWLAHRLDLPTVAARPTSCGTPLPPRWWHSIRTHTRHAMTSSQPWTEAVSQRRQSDQPRRRLCV